MIITVLKIKISRIPWNFALPKMEKKGQVTRSSLNSDNCVFLEKKGEKETLVSLSFFPALSREPLVQGN